MGQSRAQPWVTLKFLGHFQSLPVGSSAEHGTEPFAFTETRWIWAVFEQRQTCPRTLKAVCVRAQSTSHTTSVSVS